MVQIPSLWIQRTVWLMACIFAMMQIGPTPLLTGLTVGLNQTLFLRPRPEKPPWAPLNWVSNWNCSVSQTAFLSFPPWMWTKRFFSSCSKAIAVKAEGEWEGQMGVRAWRSSEDLLFRRVALLWQSLLLFSQLSLLWFLEGLQVWPTFWHCDLVLLSRKCVLKNWAVPVRQGGGGDSKRYL